MGEQHLFKYQIYLSPMKRVFPLTSLEAIGLEESHFQARSLIAVGYCTGELLPPYNSELHRERAEMILQVLSQRANTAHESVTNLSKYITGDDNIVEIVGAETNFCVVQGIDDVIDANIWAYVRPELTLTSPKTYAPFVTGRILLQEFFFDTEDQPDLRCFTYKGAFIFGKTNMIP
jgi:hypothetical protein